MTGPRAQLRKLTDQLLHSDSQGGLLAACTELHRLGTALTGLDPNSVDALLSMDTNLDCGRAIAPRNAGLCIVDFARTVAFGRGVDAAVVELRRRFPDERLEILYAGCGPFAPLIVTLLDRYVPTDLRVTLLDIHQESLDAAAKIVRAFDFEPFIADFVRADASMYRHPNPTHLVICEMLAQALRSEPQVAVTANLAPQVIAGGYFLPERITVDFCLEAPRPNFESDGNGVDRTLGARLMDLNAESIRGGVPVDFSPVVVTVPDVDLIRYRPQLLTTVNVFGTIALRDRDAGITYPLNLTIPQLAPGDRIEFTYETGRHPQFKHRRLP